MAVLTTFRTARIPHRCSRCRSTINPGQRYADSRITPGDEMNDGRAWRRSKDHLLEECTFNRDDGGPW